MTQGVLLSLLLFVVFSYMIEKMAAKGFVGRPLLVVVLINLTMTLVWPMAAVFIIEPDYAIAALLQMCAVSLFLKLVSYHHVMSDVRTPNGRVKKYSKENKEKLKP